MYNMCTAHKVKFHGCWLVGVVSHTEAHTHMENVGRLKPVLHRHYFGLIIIVVVVVLVVVDVPRHGAISFTIVHDILCTLDHIYVYYTTPGAGVH